MAKTVYIQLSIAGTDTDNFEFLSDVDSYTTPFEIGISRASLLAGYISFNAPDAASIVRVQCNTSRCTNFIDIPLSGCPSPTPTPTISITVTPTVSTTPTPTPTISITPTVTPTISITPTPTPTISITPTVTPTISITPSETPSITPSVTPSITPSVTPTITPSITPSETPSVTPSVTPSITPSETPSVTPSVTPSETPSITPSITPSETPIAYVYYNATQYSGCVQNSAPGAFIIRVSTTLDSGTWFCGDDGFQYQFDSNTTGPAYSVTAIANATPSSCVNLPC